MKKTFIFIVVLGVVGALGIGLYRGFKHWRQGNLVKQARSCLAKKDTTNAVLFLRRAIHADARDPDAWRLLADVAEATRSPSALNYRSRVVECNPRSSADRLALATTAFRMRDFASATNALEGVDEAGRKTVAYHNIAGSVASLANRLPEAESHFLEAARLEPQNPTIQLNLAVVRLMQTNNAGLAEARATLQSLRTNPAVRSQALHELAIDALRLQQTNAALALSSELAEETNSVFRDRLFQLELLRKSRSATFGPTLERCQREAGSDPSKIYDLATWLVSERLLEEAQKWLRNLPMNLRTNPPVALLAAECQILRRDWPSLSSSLENQYWAESEHLRYAFRARALRELNMNIAAKAEWEKALKSAGNQRQPLVGLVSLAARWNWSAEAEEILWSIINQFPAEKWASQALSRALYTSGRTRGLLTLYAKLAETNPSDLSAKNNLAMSALLLQATEQRPHELAREVYEKAPTNVDFVATYAFSLYVQEKSAEALKTLEQLQPEQLEKFSVCGCYGMVLKATGNGDKAKKYLDLAAKAPLLPEERKLVEKARYDQSPPSTPLSK